LVSVTAFILTWFGGHPLLVPPVAYPFWMLLAVVAAASLGTGYPGAFGERASRWAALGGLAAVALAVSIPVRIEGKTHAIDWTRVSYGFYDWERGPSGEQFRWMSSRGRFFVPSGAVRLAVPLRAYAASENDPLLVGVFVNERLASEIRVTTTAWQTTRIALSPMPTRGYHQIDLRANRVWIPARDIRGSVDLRRLSVQVGELGVVNQSSR
jgi:hypothetical protein